MNASSLQISILALVQRGTSTITAGQRSRRVELTVEDSLRVIGKEGDVADCQREGTAVTHWKGETTFPSRSMKTRCSSVLGAPTTRVWYSWAILLAVAVAVVAVACFERCDTVVDKRRIVDMDKEDEGRQQTTEEGDGLGEDTTRVMR